MDFCDITCTCLAITAWAGHFTDSVSKNFSGPAVEKKNE